MSSSIGIPGALAPALLNRKSRRPNASFVRAKSASTDAGSLTSAGTASARSPSAPASAFVCSSGSGRRPASTTDHPSRSIASAQARPTPVPAPVIIATLPCPFISLLLLRAIRLDTPAPGDGPEPGPEAAGILPQNIRQRNFSGPVPACTLFCAIASEAAPRTDETCGAHPWPHEVVALRTGGSLEPLVHKTPVQIRPNCEDRHGSRRLARRMRGEGCGERAAFAPPPRPGCPTMMDPIRYPIRTTVTALVIAAAAAYPGEAAERDCAPGEIHADVDGRSLTPEEKIARMDEALRESLARFDECQAAASVSADGGSGVKGAQGNAAGGGGSGRSVAGEGATAERRRPTARWNPSRRKVYRARRLPKKPARRCKAATTERRRPTARWNPSRRKVYRARRLPKKPARRWRAANNRRARAGSGPTLPATSPTTSPSPTTTASSKPRSAGRRWRRPTRGSGPSSGTSTASTRGCPRGRSPDDDGEPSDAQNSE